MGNREISKAIESATGYKYIKVFKRDGVCRFYFPENVDNQGLDLSKFECVYANSINQLNTEQWVKEFQDLLIKHKNS